MDAELEVLYKEYDEILSKQKFIEEDLDYSLLDKHIEFLERLNVVENSSISIFDLFKREHLYLSSGFENILGYDLTRAREEGNEYFNSRVHPDDFRQSIKIANHFLRLGFQLPIEEMISYKLINEYRVKVRTGKYIRVIEQFQALELDIHGNVWLALCILDISPDQDPGVPMRSKLLNFKTGQLFHFPDEINPGTDTAEIIPDTEAPALKLARREQEILGLISEGMISKEIADKLYISVHTVNTHRQRIMEKLNARNIHEAINKARALGIFR